MNKNQKTVQKLERETKQTLALALLAFLAKHKGLALLIALPALQRELTGIVLGARQSSKEAGAPDSRHPLEAQPSKPLKRAVAGVLGLITREALTAPESSPVAVIKQLEPLTDRIVTTEIIDANATAVLTASKHVQWSSTLEKNSCPTCTSRHNQIYKVADCPSIPHANCRCTLIQID